MKATTVRAIRPIRRMSHALAPCTPVIAGASVQPTRAQSAAIGPQANTMGPRLAMDVRVFFGVVLGKIIHIPVDSHEIAWWTKTNATSVGTVD